MNRSCQLPETRWKNGSRHRGHSEDQVLKELRPRLAQDPVAVLGVGTLIVVDTSGGDFRTAFLAALAALEPFLPARAPQ